MWRIWGRLPARTTDPKTEAHLSLPHPGCPEVRVQLGPELTSVDRDVMILAGVSAGCCGFDSSCGSLWIVLMVWREQTDGMVDSGLGGLGPMTLNSRDPGLETS